MFSVKLGVWGVLGLGHAKCKAWDMVRVKFETW